MIKGHKNNEEDFDEYDLKTFVGNSQKNREEPISPFKNKIKMLLNNYQQKRPSTLHDVNPDDPHYKFITPKNFEPKPVME